MEFITSLHTQTEYSFLESTIKIDSLIEHAKKYKLKKLVITDHNNMFGVAEFIHKCNKNKIEPVIGIDLDVQDFRLILIAKNYEGFVHLNALASKKGFNQKIEISDIDDRNIYIIDHPLFGYYKTKNQFLKFQNYFIATEENLPNAVYVNQTRILLDEDKQAINVVDSIRLGKIVTDQGQEVPYFTKVDTHDIRVKQVQIILNSCNIVFPKQTKILPEFKSESNLSSISFLKKIINDSIKEKIKTNLVQYKERIKFEISIIEKLGFEDYFLIIWDLIKWSKDRKILIGPGRGSSAGSLICFVLGITEIDPIKYELLFERFLNPNRVSMPDIDVDIQDDRREEVINYLFEKYGQKNTALISTFQRLAAKSAIKDVARLYNIPTGDVNDLNKLIPNFATLDEAYNSSYRFRASINKDPKLKKIFDLAKKIEGLPRQHGTHAAGIIISNDPIQLRGATIISSEGHSQIQSSMDYLEENGFLKIDLLGLRNLTIIQTIQKEIFKNFNKKVSLKKIPDVDAATNKILSEGFTNGVFQLESYGMKKTLTKVGVSSLDDITAILSLYRPGPMEFIDNYALRKAGKEKIETVAPEYDKVLKNTYGIIVYQEQIMQIAQIFSGMSFAQADILRRAIGKKKIELINSLKKDFIAGALAKGHSEDIVKKVYANIEKFADYGFNKSHAVAYAKLSYIMAFLKARFPFEFYTSLLKASEGSLSGTKTYVNEMKLSKIQVVTPEVNISRPNVFNDKNKVVLPLNTIKGLGEIAAKKIFEEKSKGNFKDFFDLVVRLKLN